ncbi:TonB-dependent receptor plug domain-containing protein [Sphingobacterium sp. KU25419]|nr:TonB-dependent receptor plug domain-containing protein [Sphingobacterium sp. KU25419]
MKRKLNVNITGSMTAFVLLFGTVPIAKASSLHYALINAQQISQDKQIKGKITDESGKPLVGVTIKVKGTSIGTKTDSEGNFNLNAKANQTLVITYVGYISKEVPIGTNPTNLTITLDTDVNMLEETVVVGFGRQKKVNLTGAVATVDAKAFENRAVSNVGQALQGVMPGLNITQSKGYLNSSPSINIRGVGTIGEGSSSSPLILVDGIESDINRVNPQDIESVSVLKDAASSSIYGSRAPFGVILITTKKGKQGKISTSFNSSLRWQN